MNDIMRVQSNCLIDETCKELTCDNCSILSEYNERQEKVKNINELFLDDYEINHEKDNQINEVVHNMQLFFDDYAIKSLNDLKLYILLYSKENKNSVRRHYHLYI